MSEDRPSAMTREELLGGLPARRASLALYAIESHTARLALEARHATAPAICENMVATRERAFLSAVRAGRELPVGPSIQELERFAPQWAHLAPRDAGVRAELASRLAARHRFRMRDVPRLRAALELDGPEVAQAYLERTAQPITSLFEARLAPGERLRWFRSRVASALEDLPPLWTAYSLTLTQTVGAGVLALPIALAGIGPLPGLVLIAVLGGVNVLTVVAVAEAFARTGTVRWGGAYFGRVVAQHLGRGAGMVVAGSLALLSVVVLLAYYVGLATTLSVATGIPTPVWAVAMFVVTVAFVWRGTLEATVLSALVVGAVNIVIVIVLSALAAGRVDLANLTRAEVPLVGGRPFDPAILGLVFGVVLLAFFGHTAVANGARVVLRRDPSGRALIRGTGAAMLTSIALYGVWTVTVGGAVAPERLAQESGTALAPLADAVGPVVLVFGSLFVVLAMGMAAVHFSIGLHYQMTELVPWTGRAARLAGLAPLVGVFVVVQWLLVTGRESFTGALGFVGTLTAPLLIGVFPILLLVAARRRGDYVPDEAPGWIGSRVVAAPVYVLYLAAVVAHGAVVWLHPLERGLAFTMALVVVAVTVGAVRSGALQPLAAVEVRRDRELARYRLRATARGHRVRTSVRVRHAGGGDEVAAIDGAMDLPEGAAGAVLELDPDGARQLRLWAHETDTSGATAPLAVRVSVRDGQDVSEVVVDAGQALLPLRGERVLVELDLDISPARPPRPGFPTSREEPGS